MSTIFRFKQFQIDQQGSAMKINTDGVLLGAIGQPVAAPKRILDIGTGTGVIALMLAQRYPDARIDGVEIDQEAADCARRNFEHSPFADRLHLVEGSFAHMDTPGHYDWIISNPPFYTRSLHSPNERKRNAKHTDWDFFQRLIAFARSALSPGGELHLILPTALARDLTPMATEAGLFERQTVSIRSYPHSEVIRQIVCLQKGEKTSVLHSDFVIYERPHQHSAAYRQLLQPFFLAF